MDSYNKKAVNIVGVIAVLCVVFGLGGWFLTHNNFIFYTPLIILGLSFVYFSRDLTLEGVAKYNINYRFFRVGYIVVGTLLAVIGLVLLIKN